MMWTRWIPAIAFAAALWSAPAVAAGGPVASLADTITDVQPKIVKVYGAGGFAGLEAYQTGVLISTEGHVLTVFSHVLDSAVITVTLDDGRRYEAELLGADPELELAVLKIDAEGVEHFDLSQAAGAQAGSPVLVFTNMFGVATGNEHASVQQGTVMAVVALSGRRGVYQTPYRGPVYVVDTVTSNPGSAGGALTDQRGRLLGLVGKELRNTLNNTWLNYAIPIDQLVDRVAAIRSGQQLATVEPSPGAPVNGSMLARLGVILVPDVLDRTPAYIDVVRRGSTAAQAGCQPDDLIVFVNGQLIQSQQSLLEQLGRLEAGDSFVLGVMRLDELVEVVIPTDGLDERP